MHQFKQYLNILNCNIEHAKIYKKKKCLLNRMKPKHINFINIKYTKFIK